MNKQILIIEDDVALNELVSRTINKITDCSSQSVFNGDDGLQAIAEAGQPFDLIVLDLSLPDVDGLEFIRRLSETSFSGGIIIASGHSMAVLNAARQLAGYHNITVLNTLRKPISPGQLRETIENASVPANSSKVDEGDRKNDIAGSQLIPYYQPQIDVYTGAVVGFEALIRLQLVDGPLVGPNVLFSHIRSDEERISTTLEITGLVLRDLKKALSETGDFPGVSINFDARVLEDNSAIAVFTDMVGDAAVEP